MYRAVVAVGSAIVVHPAASCSSVPLKLAKRAMNELDAHRALAHCRCHSLDAARADVPDREDTRPARLQQFRSAGQRPPSLLELTGEEVGAGLDEALVVHHHASFEPGRVRIGPGHQEQVIDLADLRLARVELTPADPLETIGPLEPVDLVALAQRHVTAVLDALDEVARHALGQPRAPHE